MKGENGLTLILSRWRLIIWALLFTLWVLPLIAMGFTHEVEWQVGDFLVAGLLLGIIALGIEYALRLNAGLWVRSGLIFGTVIAVALVWILLAIDTL